VLPFITPRNLSCIRIITEAKPIRNYLKQSINANYLSKLHNSHVFTGSMIQLGLEDFKDVVNLFERYKCDPLALCFNFFVVSET
jgi:hypothetical protein